MRTSQLNVGTSTDVSLKISESDLSLLTASIRAPSGHEEPCLLKRLPNRHIGTAPGQGRAEPAALGGGHRAGWGWRGRGTGLAGPVAGAGGGGAPGRLGPWLGLAGEGHRAGWARGCGRGGAPGRLGPWLWWGRGTGLAGPVAVVGEGHRAGWAGGSG
ncbi:adenine phosphoribosyltransferase [Platysternon megacephalum]|uniref:Adenine phosphoribosyltransferase n=1 Tax=Platysternon megacephalum TaxID=55544 RepID=A0A4D9DIV3_9SAUR|nr:adenine phosphoribosyltransferase [Platysternon megacephalum]